MQQFPNHNYNNSNGNGSFHPKPKEELEALESTFDFKLIWYKIVDNWKLVAFCLVVAFAIAYMMNRYTTPVYVVNTSLLISEPQENNSSASDYLFGSELFGKKVSNLENETILLRSYGLIENTLKKLNLNVSYYKKGDIKSNELYKQSPITVAIPKYSSKIPYGIFIKCKILDEKNYQLEIEESGYLDKITEVLTSRKKKKVKNIFAGKKFEFGEVMKVGEFAFKIDFDKSKYQSAFNQEIWFVIDKYDRLTKIYQSAVSISPFTEESSILKISMEGTSPYKVIDFLNALVQNYMQNELREKNNIALRTVDFINTQILNMSDSLQRVEDQLETFKRTTTPVNLSEEGSKLYDDGQGMEKERGELILTNRYLDELQTYVNTDNLEQIFSPSSIGVNDPALNASVQSLIDLQLDIKVMEADKNLDNPYIRVNKQKIAQLKNSISENIKGLKSGNELRIDNLNTRLSKVNYSLRSLPTAEREFVNIQRTHDLRENLYLFLMQKKAEAGIAKASNTVDFRVVDEAKVQGLAPIKPSPGLNYAVAIFLGLSIPLAFIFLTDMLNNKVNSKEDIAKLTNIPFLGVVAENKSKRELIIGDNAKSATAETIRSIRSNLRYLTQGKKGNITFLVTSTLSGEGKTFCSKNLAYIFSNFGKSVLLVNADMRKRNYFEEFGVPDEVEVGLSDYLAGIVEKEEIIQRTDFEDLHIIKAGNIPPNPSELLIGDSFNTFLKEVKSQYDYVILDTPPIGIISDGIELMGKTDVNIFVIRQDVTLKSQARDIDHLYATGQVNNLAILFNDVNFKRLNYGYGYYMEDPNANPWWWKRMFGRDKKMWKLKQKAKKEQMDRSKKKTPKKFDKAPK